MSLSNTSHESRPSSRPNVRRQHKIEVIAITVATFSILVHVIGVILEARSHQLFSPIVAISSILVTIVLAVITAALVIAHRAGRDTIRREIAENTAIEQQSLREKAEQEAESAEQRAVAAEQRAVAAEKKPMIVAPPSVHLADEYCKGMLLVNRIIHETRDKLARARGPVESAEVVAPRLIEVCDVLSDYCRVMFGDDSLAFRSSIKGFNGHRHVVTVARNVASMAGVTPQYDSSARDIMKEMDFKELYFASVDHFACDNLSALRNYANTNPQRRETYNAAFVIPIRKMLGVSDETKKFQIGGFLAVDCLPVAGRQVFYCEPEKLKPGLLSFMEGVATGLFPLLQPETLKSAATTDNGYCRDPHNFRHMAELHGTYLRQMVNLTTRDA